MELTRSSAMLLILYAVRIWLRLRDMAKDLRLSGFSCSFQSDDHWQKMFRSFWSREASSDDVIL